MIGEALGAVFGEARGADEDLLAALEIELDRLRIVLAAQVIAAEADEPGEAAAQGVVDVAPQERGGDDAAPRPLDLLERAGVAIEDAHLRQRNAVTVVQPQ